MIRFLRTRYSYDSYMDFWSLVTLSNFHVDYVDEVNLLQPGDIYVMCPMNGEWKPIVEKQLSSPTLLKSVPRVERSVVLLWNLERPYTGLTDYIHDNQALIDSGYVDGVLVSDKRLSDDTGFIFLPMGSCDRLGTPGSVQDKVYDAIHLSCYSYNRGMLFNDPSHPKDKIGPLTIATNGWGADRDQRLKQTRFMINLHQDSNPYIEPLRFALAAAYELIIVSEPCYDPTPYGKPYIHYASKDCLVDYISEYLLPNYVYWNEMGKWMRSLYTGPYSFQNFVMSCLPRIVEEKLK